MIKKFLLLLTPLLLAACAAPQPMNVCSQPAGQPVNVKYGDSYITVTPPLQVLKKDKYLKFKLMGDNQPGPDGLDYGKVKVTIVAKDATNKLWLNKSGTEDGAPNGILEACMPANQPVNETFEYLVKIEEVGQLDPRVRVIP